MKTNNIISKNNLKKHFGKRASDYEKYSNWCKDQILYGYCTEPLQDMSNLVECLDVGGGTGWIPFKDFSKNDRKWTVLDLSPDMGAKIRPGIEFITGDAELMPFSNKKFGYILIRSLLQYVNAKKVLNECARVITDRGYLVVAQRVLRLPGLEENQWLSEYRKVRNPLVKTKWSIQEQEDNIRNSGFRVLRTYTYKERRTIPLEMWLSRSNTVPLERQNRLRELIITVPREVQDFIDFSIKDQILTYNRLWAITISRIETTKSKLVPIVISMFVEREIDNVKHLLLQKRKKRYEEPYKYFNSWELPQGKIEIADDIETQIKRELFEETKLDLTKCLSSIKVSNELTPLFIEELKPFSIVRTHGDIEFLGLAIIIEAIGEPKSLDINREHTWIPVSKLPQLLQSDSFYPLNKSMIKDYIMLNCL